MQTISKKMSRRRSTFLPGASEQRRPSTRGLEQRLLQSHHENELENFEKYQELRNSLPLQ